MKNPEFRTEWPALILSLLVQVPIVAGALWAALNASSDFVWGLVLLGPFEIVRLVVFNGLATAFQKSSPVQALRSFAVNVVLLLAFFAGLFAFYWGITFGVSNLIEVMSRPWIWGAMLVPAALIVAESAVSVLFFRGDARAQAARLGAMAADAKAWFALALMAFALALCMLLFAAIVPGAAMVFLVCMLLFPALYFAGKAIVLAQVYTAYFMSTGRRALDMPWLLRLTSKGEDVSYLQAVQDEAKAADERRLALRAEAMAQQAI